MKAEIARAYYRRAKSIGYSTTSCFKNRFSASRFTPRPLHKIQPSDGRLDRSLSRKHERISSIVPYKTGRNQIKHTKIPTRKTRTLRECAERFSKDHHTRNYSLEPSQIFRLFLNHWILPWNYRRILVERFER
jgi:hypothetical protein